MSNVLHETVMASKTFIRVAEVWVPDRERTLLEFGWRRDDAGILIANVKADAFCHSMVRSLVGACAAVWVSRARPERKPTTIR